MSVAMRIFAAWVVGTTCTSIAFFVYNLVRTLSETFGLSWEVLCTGVFLANAAILLTLLPIVVICIALSSEFHVSTSSAICATCEYPLRPSRSARCPECGTPAADIRSRPAVARPSYRNTFLTSIICAITGAMLAEAAVTFDESRFREEVSSGATQLSYYERQRAWPNGNGTLIYDIRTGFSATE
jgi:Zn finger protein HypA/HybF involved in hydrogenase expression